MTFFDSLKHSYKNVEINNDLIETTSFLDATESMTTLFDLLGSSAFAVVRNDLLGNVKKIRQKHSENPSAFNTLQSLALSEKNDKKKSAAEALLWLKRGLEFTALALRKSVADQNEELNVSFASAYESTLKPHHSFVVKPIFNLALKAVPFRKEFYQKLGSDQEKVKAQLLDWLAAFEKQVAILKKFFDSGMFNLFNDKEVDFIK